MTRSPTWACVAAMGVLLGLTACFGHDTSRIQPFLDRLAHAPDAELPTLLYGYSQVRPPSQGILLNFVRIVRAPSQNQNLQVVATRSSGPFTMVVARVPWSRDPRAGALQPILVHGASERATLAGYVLPFDDLIPLLSLDEMASATELSSWYVEQYGALQRSGG